MKRLKAHFVKRRERGYILSILGFDYMANDFVCYCSYFCKNKNDAKQFGEIYCQEIIRERFCDSFYVIGRISIKKYVRRYYEQIYSKRST